MFAKAVSKMKVLYQGESIPPATTIERPSKKRKRDHDQELIETEEKSSTFSWWNSSRTYQKRIDILEGENRQLRAKIHALSLELETMQEIMGDLKTDLTTARAELDTERSSNKGNAVPVTPSLSRSPSPSSVDEVSSTPKTPPVKQDSKTGSTRGKRNKVFVSGTDPLSSV